MVAPELQVGENGVELTVREVHRWSGLGAISLRNEERRLASCTPLAFDEVGWLLLSQGSYKVIYNEIVNIPKDLIAVGKPRSSLLRSGATVASAVWDAGYSGRGESLLLVYNPDGLRLQKDARVLQLFFLHLAETVKRGYRGAYQKENI
jgi:dUTP pyrophosphatase